MVAVLVGFSVRSLFLRSGVFSVAHHISHDTSTYLKAPRKEGLISLAPPPITHLRAGADRCCLPSCTLVHSRYYQPLHVHRLNRKNKKRKNNQFCSSEKRERERPSWSICFIRRAAALPRDYSPPFLLAHVVVCFHVSLPCVARSRLSRSHVGLLTSDSSGRGESARNLAVRRVLAFQ